MIVTFLGGYCYYSTMSIGDTYMYSGLRQDGEDNSNIMLTWAPEGQSKKEGKTKKTVEVHVYHRNRKNTRRLANMERGRGLQLEARKYKRCVGGGG